MVAFLFWNVANRPALDLIASACRSYRVDLLILAECDLECGSVLHAVNDGRSEAFYQEVLPQHRRVRLFSSLPGGAVHRLFDGLRISICALRRPLGPELLVAAAHLPSKLHSSSNEQYFGARDLQIRIAESEARVGHSNTIVIGDLNMNPFETGMVAADGLHGVMSKGMAAGGSRRFKGQQCSFFYNPMWSRLGDESLGPPGTYFYRDSGLECLFWHTFDQVLLRPSLLPYCRPDRLRVLTAIGEHTLADALGLHSGTGDHLPIFVELATEGAI
jgi:hypothetical protein